MLLEKRDKELAAIGASIGANCRPCIEYHLGAAREAGLSAAELDDAVATAHAVRREAVDLLAARIDELLGHRSAEVGPAVVVRTSVSRELVALGVSLGANAHALLRVHIAAALDAGLELSQIRSALKMAAVVQQHAAAITAEEVTSALTAAAAVSAGAATSS